MTEKQAREALDRMRRRCPKPDDGGELVIWLAEEMLGLLAIEKARLER